jgi:hypothetical protein
VTVFVFMHQVLMSFGLFCARLYPIDLETWKTRRDMARGRREIEKGQKITTEEKVVNEEEGLIFVRGREGGRKGMAQDSFHHYCVA